MNQTNDNQENVGKMELSKSAAVPQNRRRLFMRSEQFQKTTSIQQGFELETMRFNHENIWVTRNSSSLVKDYAKAILRHPWIFFLSVAAVTVAVYAGLAFQTPMYEGKVKMLISGEKQIQASYYREIGMYRNVPIVFTQSEIVNSGPIIQKAAQGLNLYGRPLDYEKNFSSPIKKFWIEWNTARMNKQMENLKTKDRADTIKQMVEDQLRRRIQVSPIRDTNLFVISVKEFTAEASAASANMVSRAYIAFDMEQQLAELQLKYGDKHTSIIELKETIEKINRNLNGTELSNIEAIGPASVKTIEQAHPPLKPVSIPKVQVWTIGIFLGLILGCSLALLADYFDPTFKTPEDIETTLRVPLIGSVAKADSNNRSRKKKGEGSSLFTRSYQNLSDHIYLLSKTKDLKTVLICSISNDQDANHIVYNVGTYLAYHTDRRILLIDSNLRNPTLYKQFNLSQNGSFMDVLEGKMEIEQATVSVGKNLTFLPIGGAGADNFIPVLERFSISESVKRVQDNHDITFLTCANLEEYKDAYLLSSYVDSIVLVVTENQTKRESTLRLIENLESLGANLIGVILTTRSFHAPRSADGRI